jgi:hypothetical protein
LNNVSGSLVFFFYYFLQQTIQYMTIHSNLLFKIGLGIDLLLLLLLAQGWWMMNSPMQGVGGQEIPAGEGMTNIGRQLTVALPLVLVALMLAGYGLYAHGRSLAANVVVWIPALPVMLALLLWGGLALVFVVFG